MHNVFVLILICWVVIAYWPGRRLFFRNDDWFYIARIEKFLAWRDGSLARAFFLRDVVHELDFIRHFHPGSLLLLAGKYKFFGGNYGRHFLVSLGLHLGCAGLIHAVVLTYTGSWPAAVLAGGAFALSPVLADTLLWAGQASFILITLATLAACLLHPISGGGIWAGAAFFLVCALAPFVFEFGFLTIGLGILLFGVPGPLGLGARVAGAGTLGLLALGHLWLRAAGAGLPRHTFFVGPLQLGRNVVLGLGKALGGLFGLRCRLVVTDTLYVWEPLFGWWLAGTPLWLLVLARMTPPEGATLLVMACLLVTACLPFVVISFAMDRSNPNPDLAHRLPRYMYLPAGLLALVLGLLLGEGGVTLPEAVTLGAMSLATGLGGIRQTIAALRPHTDVLRREVDRMRATGQGPTPRHYQGVQDHRLDWSFTAEHIRALLRLEQGRG